MTDYTFYVDVTGTFRKSYTVPADSIEDAEDIVREMAEADVNKGNMAGWDMTTDVHVVEVEYQPPWRFYGPAEAASIHDRGQD